MKRSIYRTIRHIVGDAAYDLVYLGARVKVYRRSPMGELRTISAQEASAVLKHFEEERQALRQNALQAEREQEALLRWREQYESRWWRRLRRWVMGLFTRKGGVR